MMIIGIEGPAGSGKTTMARTVAADIDAVVVEGGVWYRALAYKANNTDTDLADTAALCRLALQLDVQLQVGEAGTTRVLLDGKDVTNDLYTEQTAAKVAVISLQLPVRDIVEPQIVAGVRAYENVIVVGRHLKKVLPEAAVLRIEITDEEIARRSAMRNQEAAEMLARRNQMDRATAAVLGAMAQDIAEPEVLDVTGMSPAEQADALRQFVRAAFPRS